MSTTNLSERLESLGAEQAEQRELALHTLARQIADDQAPTDAEIIEQLDAMRKTPRELEQAVQRIRQRREWAVVAAELPARQKEEQSAKLAMENETQRFAVAHRDHQIAEEKLDGEFRRAMRRTNEARSARERLLQSVLPHEKTQLAELRQRAGQLRSRLDFLNRDLNEERDEAMLPPQSREALNAAIFSQPRKSLSTLSTVSALRQTREQIERYRKTQRDWGWERRPDYVALTDNLARLEKQLAEHTAEREEIQQGLPALEAEQARFERTIVAVEE